MALNRYQSQKLMVSTVPKGTGENGIGLSILLGYQNTIPVHALITTPSFHVYKAYTHIKIQTFPSLTNNLTINFLFL